MESNLKTERQPSDLFLYHNRDFIPFVRACEVCGDSFRMVTWNNKYCSAECRKQLRFSSKSKICPTCETPFMSKTYNQKYCNVECKDKMNLRKYHEKRRKNGKAN